jgi:hypothetical protein
LLACGESLGTRKFEESTPISIACATDSCSDCVKMGTYRPKHPHYAKHHTRKMYPVHPQRQPLWLPDIVAARNATPSSVLRRGRPPGLPGTHDSLPSPPMPIPGNTEDGAAAWVVSKHFGAPDSLCLNHPDLWTGTPVPKQSDSGRVWHCCPHSTGRTGGGVPKQTTVN